VPSFEISIAGYGMGYTEEKSEESRQDS